MKRLLLLGSILTLGLVSSCTQNERAKMYGGTATINLEPNQKLVDVTWKETSIWYMTKPMSSTDSAETYTFQEESSFGMVQGKVIFIESK
jgi:hypothetical protein